MRSVHMGRSRLLAVILPVFCLLALFGGIGARPAYAAEAGNIAFSVPSKVPFAVKADGTTVGPSATAWRIENVGTRPLRMRDVAASGFSDGSAVSAVSEAMPVAGTSSRGIWSVSAGRGGASLTPSTDGTIEIPVGGGAGFTWSADLAAGTKHAATPAPAGLGSVSFTLGGADRVAFAVYSADDQSLNFYKRMDVPAVGDTFEGKAVTEVYTGIETEAYGLAGGGWYDAVTTPWYGRRGDILSASVIDDGIAPKDLGYYFQNLENATSIDISKFSAPAARGLFHTFSGCTKLTDVALGPQSPQTMDSAFTNCKALSSVDLRPLDLDSVQVCCFLFAGCSSLRTIKGVADVGKNNPYRIEEAFLGCSSLESLDLSGWNTSYAIMNDGHVVNLFDGCKNLRSVKIGSNWTWNPNGYGLLPSQSFAGADGKWYSTATGKGYAPADIPSGKADTYVASKEMLPKVAFAVYSADDGSLDFYKRAFCDVPTAGGTFEGKAVTNVYIGFETEAYTGTWPNDDCPWFDIAGEVKSVAVVDAIRPRSMAWWFNQFTACTSFDLGNIDTGKCVSFARLFSSCGSVETNNLRGLEKWDAGNVLRMDACFDGMFKLTEIPGISGWDTGSCTDFASAFFNCTRLQRLDISHWSNESVILGAYRYVLFGHSGGGYPDLEYVKIGAGWDHVGDLLRNTNTLMKVTGADGNWYALSDGNGYSSDTAPDNKADTYYTTKALLDQAKTPTAFAVYSADDHSLDFYKRPRYMMPVSRSTFEGKAATSVYTGFETASYGKKDGSDSYIPWASVAGSVLNAKVVDDGIAPISIAHWFDYFYELRTCDLGKLNVANVTSMDGTFYQNYALSSLTMPTSEFSSLVNMSSAFTVCSALKSVDLSRVNFSNITDLAWTFAGCNSLVLDCSDWDVSNVASYGHFNTDAPGVILPKAWQPTAFAVFSADDGSLDFYKREYRKVPKAGDTFEGKAVTEVYTGFETETYYNQDAANDGSWYIQVPNTPWRSICKSVRSVKIVDDGLAPQSINYWFYDMANMTNIDVSKLDTSRCTDFRMTFGCCLSLTEIDVSGWSTDSLVGLNGTFLGCISLKSLKIGGWDTSRVESYHCLFHECCSLVGDAMQLAVDSLDVTDSASDFCLMFEGCTQLGSIDLSNWSFAGASSMWGMFSECANLQLDCSGWNVRSDTSHGDFNKDAPGVILPKAWQDDLGADTGNSDAIDASEADSVAAEGIHNSDAVDILLAEPGDCEK